jgi:hypothetical protein
MAGAIEFLVIYKRWIGKNKFELYFVSVLLRAKKVGHQRHCLNF